MAENPLIAAVDWGTTSFRIWSLGEDGKKLNFRTSNRGMSALKQSEFGPYLEAILAEMSLPEHLPVIICGMAGAAQGWIPAPYVDTPTALDRISVSAVSVPHPTRDIRILPGVAQRKEGAQNVMRGEETLLMGAAASSDLSGWVCMPGTHSKWVRLDENRITNFSTIMTGELYALLSRHSTLSHFLDLGANTDEYGTEFTMAVEEALRAPERVFERLFSIRAIPLLDGNSGRAIDMPARLSGLLTGMEIASIRASEKVTLIAEGVLARTYRRAFEIADIECTFLEAGPLSVLGLAQAARELKMVPEEVFAP